MDLDSSATLASPPGAVFEAVEDLATYPDWLSLVDGAEPAPPGPGDPGPAWDVDLVMRLGPISRSKRVRMVRAHHDPGSGSVHFERRELDGRQHNAWVLRARAEPDGGGCRLTLSLHYGGAPALPGLDAVLAQETRKAGGRLEARLAAAAGGRGHGTGPGR